MIRRLTAVAAVALAAEVLVSLSLQFLILQPIIDIVGPDFYHWLFTCMYWLRLLASGLVVIGLIASWRMDRWAGMPGAGQLVVGIAMLWGWSLLNRFVDVWSYSSLTQEQLDRVPLDEQIILLGWVSTVSSIVVDLIAVAFLILGARRLRAAQRARTPGMLQ